MNNVVNIRALLKGTWIIRGSSKIQEDNESSSEIRWTSRLSSVRNRRVPFDRAMNGENTGLNMSETVNPADKRLQAAMQPTERGTFSEVHPGKQTELPRYSASDIPASADLTWGARRTNVDVTEKVSIRKVEEFLMRGCMENYPFDRQWESCSLAIKVTRMDDLKICLYFWNVLSYREDYVLLRLDSILIVN